MADMAGDFERWASIPGLDTWSYALCLPYFFLRYALDSWSPMAIEQLFGMARDDAGYISTVFHWVGFLDVVAAGLINGLGSIGPIFQEQIIGWILYRYGYAESFQLLIVMASVGVIGTVYLAWRSRTNRSSL